jgi:glycosyltransferase involved in cell wall biosynthesis
MNSNTEIKTPKVSVITPVYNCEKYIQRAIVSLMEQTLDDVEYIIIDDGSTDSSLNIIKSVLEKYKHRNVKLISRPNCGVAATRDEGMSLATGEYTIHLDSDDWAEVSWLEDMYNKAISECADIVVCEYNVVTKLYKSKHLAQFVSNNKLENIKSLLIGKICNSNWNKLTKRQLYTANKIKFLQDINMGEDFLVSLKLFYYSKKISIINRPLYNYYIGNEESLTISYSKKSLHDLSKAVGLSEQFCRDKKIFSECSNELSRLKVNVKSKYVLHSNFDYELVVGGLSLYPELDNLFVLRNAALVYSFFYFLNRVGLIKYYKIFSLVIIEPYLRLKIILGKR